MKTIIYLDPSINRMGYCLLRDGEDGTINIWKSGVIKSKGAGFDRLKSLTEQLNRILVIPPNLFVIEIPGTFAYTRHTNKMSGKGLNAEALQRNNWVIGALILRAQQLNSELELIEAHQWKGRMTKNDSILIATNLLKSAPADHNHADAVALAAWHCKGLLR